MLLLDTNVVSELRKAAFAQPTSRFSSWARRVDTTSTFLSVVSLLEIEQGILALARRDSPQAAILRRWFETKVQIRWDGRMLAVTSAVALRAAALHVPDPKPERDCLIAATALVHGMTVATRNVRDFAPMGVQILNPWLA